MEKLTKLEKIIKEQLYFKFFNIFMKFVQPNKEKNKTPVKTQVFQNAKEIKHNKIDPSKYWVLDQNKLK